MAKIKHTWRVAVKPEDSQIRAPIPLEKEEKASSKKGKDQKVEYQLKVNPTEENSETYKETVLKFGTGTPEELLTLLKQVKKIFTGLSLTTGPNQYALMRTILVGDALRVFEEKARGQQTETVNGLKACLEALKEQVFPMNALYKQLTYFRAIKKPRNMSMRKFYSRMLELNEFIPEFPNASENDKNDETRLKMIVESAIPKEWNRKLYEQNFYPTRESIEDFIAKLEAFEDVESETYEIPRKSRAEGGSGKRKALVPPSQGNTSGKFYCELHGENPTHNTDKCYTLKNMKKSLASNKKQASVKKHQEKLEANVMSMVKKAIPSVLKKHMKAQESNQIDRKPAAKKKKESSPEASEATSEADSDDANPFAPSESDASDSSE